jgi:hypothetical protein
MAKKINIVGKKLERIEVKGAALPRIEPTELAAALDAESCGEIHANLNILALGELGNELLKRLRSTGGRPALEGTTERCKVPLSPEDIAKLEQIIAIMEAETGKRPALGQIASVILSAHLKTLGDSRKKHAHCDTSKPAHARQPKK